VSREIRRNGGREAYRAHDAEAAALQRSRRPKKAKPACEPVLRALVEEMLDQRWSPAQIAGRLELLFPGEPAMRGSHETIYLSLYDPRRRAVDRKLSRRLRTARLMRRPRKARAATGQGQIKDMTPIKARPPKTEDRVVPGHWEGDLIMGTRPSAIATLVERTSRYVKLVALPGGNKAHCLTGPRPRSRHSTRPCGERPAKWLS